MRGCTYYDILGISRDASMQDITNAKNTLAKKYHPDANMNNSFDTTPYMQMILEAYRVLSNAQARKEYDKKTFGSNHVFQTFDLHDTDPEDNLPENSFVPYWRAADRLHKILEESKSIFQERADIKKSLLRSFESKHSNPLLLRLYKILSIPYNFYYRHRKLSPSEERQEKIYNEELAVLAAQAVECIAVLRGADIPQKYWLPDAMNWILFQWGIKKETDYHLLFAKYDKQVNPNNSKTKNFSIRNKHHSLHKSIQNLLEMHPLNQKNDKRSDQYD